MSISKTVSNIWSPVYGNEYYRFTVTELSDIHFSLEDLTDPLTLTLYDGTGKFIDQETNSLNANFAPGTYFIEIQGKSESDFTLSIDAQALSHPGGDTMASAANIGTLTATPKQFFGNLAQDAFSSNQYYKFTLTTAETVDLGVTAVNSAVAVNLLDSGGLSIASSAAEPESNGNNASIFAALGPGTYFVQVEGSNSSYTLSAWTGRPSFGGASSDKAGNTLAAARNIGALASPKEIFADWVGPTDTQDFYKFTLSTAAMVSLDLAANGFAVVSLEDADGHAFVASSTETNSDASIVRALGPGTYFIDVSWSFGGPSGAGYSLSASAPAIPDGAGNTLATARNIGALTPTAAVFNDWVGSVDPSDYYRFTVTSPAIVSAVLSEPTNREDYLRVSLLNSTGSQIDLAAIAFANYSTDGSDGSILWALPTGTYYALVQQGSGDAGFRLHAVAERRSHSQRQCRELDGYRSQYRPADIHGQKFHRLGRLFRSGRLLCLHTDRYGNR